MCISIGPSGRVHPILGGGFRVGWHAQWPLIRGQACHAPMIVYTRAIMCPWLIIIRSCLVAAAASLVAGPLVFCQTRDLLGDIGDLNIRHTTDHYALAGTVQDQKLVEYGRALEYIYEEYSTGFEELIAGAQDDRSRRPDRKTRFKVVILATDAEYEEFAGAYFGDFAEHTRGLFISQVQLLVIRDEPASHQTYEILFHEAFHQFIHRYIPAVPIWLNEGLATYYGTARPTRSGLVFDRPRSAYFKVVRNGVDAKSLIPLRELMLFDHRAFYLPQPVEGLSVTRRVLAYAQAYTLITYILQDRPGQDHLRRHLRDLAGAATAADVRRITLRDFDDSLLDSMVPDWLAMVNRH